MYKSNITKLTKKSISCGTVLELMLVVVVNVLGTCIVVVDVELHVGTGSGPASAVPPEHLLPRRRREHSVTCVWTLICEVSIRSEKLIDELCTISMFAFRNGISESQHAKKSFARPA